MLGTAREASCLWQGATQTPKQICIRELPKEWPDLLFAEENWTSALLQSSGSIRQRATYLK